MKKYFLLAIFVSLASSCANRQEGPVDQQQSPCVIDTSKLEPRICTMQYEPVCGCNGKTYGNACTAKGAGVQRIEPGTCEPMNESELP